MADDYHSEFPYWSIYYDDEGYFFHSGRSDDVIISAGWTMSAVEIENILLTHVSVAEAAVIGVPDETRGQIPKGYVVIEEGFKGDVIIKRTEASLSKKKKGDYMWDSAKEKLCGERGINEPFK